MSITAASLLVEVRSDTSSAEASLKGFSATLYSAGQRASQLGKTLSIFVSAPLALIGKRALNMAKEFETNMYVLQAVAQATGEELEGLRAEAWALGADMTLPAVSAADAAEAMTELSKAGLEVNDIMGATRGVLELAIAGQIKWARSAEIAANALQAFNLEGHEASRIADLLAAAANASSARITHLAMSLKMASAVYAMSGVPIEDVVSALTMMANAGIKGSDAGTSLKQMLLRLQAPSAKSRKLMNELGLSIYDAEGDMISMEEIIGRFNYALKDLTMEQRNQALVTMFGTDAIRAANIILTTNVDKFRAVRDEITQAGRAHEMATARTTGLGGAFEALTTASETAMLAGIIPFKQEIEDTVRSIAEAINSFSLLDEGTRKTYVTWGAMVALAGPTIFVFGKIAMGAAIAGKAIVTFVTGITTALAAWRAGMTLTTALGAAGLSPLVISLGAIAAIVGSIVAVWYQWNKQINETNRVGHEAVDQTWNVFFDDLIERGATATQVVDEWRAANLRVKSTLEGTNPFIRAFVKNQDELYASENDVNSAIAKAAGSFAEYQTAADYAGISTGRYTEIQWEAARAASSISEAQTMATGRANAAAAMYEQERAALTGASAATDEFTMANLWLGESADDVSTDLYEIESAVEEAKKAALSATDIMGILDDSFEALGLTTEGMVAEMDAIGIATGKFSEYQVQIRKDTELASGAYAAGAIGLEEYLFYASEAASGLLELSDGQREAFSAAIAHAKALYQAEEATRSFTLARLALSESLSATWQGVYDEHYDEINRLEKAQKRRSSRIEQLQAAIGKTSNRRNISAYRNEIKWLENQSETAAAELQALYETMGEEIQVEVAQAALGELAKSFEAGLIGYDDYVMAVQQTQEAFGLVNTQGIALSTGILLINKAVQDGTLAAENYDEALAALTKDASDGEVDFKGLIEAFGKTDEEGLTALERIKEVQTGLDETGSSADSLATDISSSASTAATEITALSTTAQTTATQIRTAFEAPPWGTIGANISTAIARGISTTSGLIVQAATAAAKAAYEAALAELGIKSPSKKFVYIGKMVSIGFAQGIESYANQPQLAMVKTASGVSQVPRGIAPSKSSTTQSSGGSVFVEQHFHDPGSAALGMALVRNLRRERLEASMRA